jgi:hypothetical protein
VDDRAHAVKSLPRAFVELAGAGRFDPWEGVPYRSLTKAQRTEIWARREREVLGWRGIEFDRSPEQALHDRPDWLRPGLFDFAGNGFGDRYCFYPQWQDDAAEAPIVLVLHDEMMSRLFARSFAELLLRCMLEHYASEDANRAIFSSHLLIVRPWLEPAQTRVLEDATDAKACERALGQLVASIGERTLMAVMQPTKYNEPMFKDRQILSRAYERSVAFYRELVDEGHVDLRDELEEATANRDRVKGER